MQSALLLVIALAGAATGAPAGGTPLDGGARYRQGLEAFRAGDFASAQAHFDAALSRLPAGDPLVFQSEYNLARSVEEQGRSCDAAQAFERFLAHAPTTSPVERERIEKARDAQERTRATCDGLQVAVPAPLPADPSAPRAHATVEPDTAPDPRGAVVSATVATGVLFRDGTQRTHLTPELTGGYRFGDIHGELAVAFIAEAPHAVLVRPGLRWLLAGPLYVRAAVVGLIGDTTAMGALVGPGVDLPLSGGWFLAGEVDASFWPTATSVVPIDFRAGVRRQF